ncbi:MAG: sigma-70 family RNA polymerase sigma factor [Myxococcales bacterium]|nr:sigma-70 family RNA polymerase sigma factor [Myxococcales bacterium]
MSWGAALLGLSLVIAPLEVHSAPPLSPQDGGHVSSEDEGFSGFLGLFLLAAAVTLADPWRGPRRAPRKGGRRCYPPAKVDAGRQERAKLGAGELRSALEGDEAARRALVTRLLPVVRVRIARALARLPRPGRGGGLQEILEDLTQDVFEHLLREDGRVLRGWDAERGLSLENFVGLIAEQRVAAALRTKCRNPWLEEPTDAPALDAILPTTAASDQRLAARQVLKQVVARMDAGLSEKGQLLFRRLFLEEEPAADVAEELGMTPAAVHAWSSRLRRRLREVLAEVAEEDTHHDEEAS